MQALRLSGSGPAMNPGSVAASTTTVPVSEGMDAPIPFLAKPLAEVLAAWVLEQDRLSAKPDSTRKRARRLATLFRELGWTTAAQGDRLALTALVTRMVSEGKAAVSTVETLLGQVGSVFEFAKEQGWAQVNPVDGIKRAKKARGRGMSKRRGMRAISNEECRRLVAAAETDEASPEPRFSGESAHRSHLYRVGWWTGGRLGQLTMSLKWRDTDLDGPAPHLVFDADEAKNGGSWREPLHAEALRALREWREKCAAAAVPTGPEDFVFPFRFQDHVFNADLKAAGIPKRGGPSNRPANFSSLRKTFCTNLVVSGVAPGVAQKLMQHKCVQMTMQVYAEVQDEQLAAGIGQVEKIVGFHNPLPQPHLGAVPGGSPPIFQKNLTSAADLCDNSPVTSSPDSFMSLSPLTSDRPTSPALAGICGTGDTAHTGSAGAWEVGGPEKKTAAVSSGGLEKVGRGGLEPPLAPAPSAQRRSHLSDLLRSIAALLDEGGAA